MKKKVIIIASAWVLVQLVVSCFCPDSPWDHTQIESFEVRTGKWEDLYLSDSSSVSSEDFRIIVKVRTQYIARSNKVGALLYSSYATSCENDGLEGLKVNIESIKVTSEQPLGGIAAGEPLNSLFEAYSPQYIDDSKNKRVSIVKIMMDINEEHYPDLTYYMELKDKSVSSDFVSFTITLTFEDGSERTSKTNSVKII